MMKHFLLLMAASGSLALADAPAGDGAQPSTPEQGVAAPAAVAPAAVAPAAATPAVVVSSGASCAPGALCSPGAPRFTPPTRQQIALRMMVRSLLLQKYDLDQDHELNEEERAALLRDAREAMRRQAEDMLRRFDRDKDGRLNEEELAHMRATLSCSSAADGGCATRPAPTPRPTAASRPQQKGPGKASPHGRPGKGAPAPSSRRGPGRPAFGSPETPAAENPDAAAPGSGPDAASRPRRHSMDKSARLVAFMAQHLIMAAYDTNRNGQLDVEERTRFSEDGEWLYTTREAALLKQYDTDGDGQLSEEELNAALQTLLPSRPLGPARPSSHPAHPSLPPTKMGGRPSSPPASRAGEKRGPASFGEAPPHRRNAQRDDVQETLPRDTPNQSAPSQGTSNQDTLSQGARPKETSSPESPGRKGPSQGKEPRRHGGPPPHRNAIDRMLDTHFDVDILLHLAHPKGGEDASSQTPPGA